MESTEPVASTLLPADGALAPAQQSDRSSSARTMRLYLGITPHSRVLSLALPITLKFVVRGEQLQNQRRSPAILTKHNTQAMDLRRKGHGSQSTMSRCVKAATKLRLEHASPRLSEQGCGEQKKCRKGPARDSPRISAYPTAGKTNSPRLTPAASNPLPPTSSYSDPKKSPPKNFCPLTNPQPYQREQAERPLT